MARKIIRAGIVAVFAGAAMTVAVPAHAYQVGPYGQEYIVTYFSNAQHTTEVGQLVYGSCGYSDTGTTSAYSTTVQYACSG
jgi:hypothetical protein